MGDFGEYNQKFFFFEFLLLLIGLTSKDFKKYGRFLIVYSTFCLVAVFLFRWRTFEQTLPLAIPFIVVMALGLKQILSWPKKWKILFFTFAAFEIIAFLNFY